MNKLDIDGIFLPLETDFYIEVTDNAYNKIGIYKGDKVFVRTFKHLDDFNALDNKIIAYVSEQKLLKLKRFENSSTKELSKVIGQVIGVYRAFINEISEVQNGYNR